MSNHRQLNLKELLTLDGGKVHLAFMHALQQATRDVIDRPGDKTKRKVTLFVELTPNLSEDNAVLDTVSAQFRVKTDVPVRRSRAYPMLPTDEGALLFSEHAPMDPRQTDFAFDASRAAEEDQEAAAKAERGGEDDDGDDPDIADI